MGTNPHHTLLIVGGRKSDSDLFNPWENIFGIIIFVCLFTVEFVLFLFFFFFFWDISLTKLETGAIRIPKDLFVGSWIHYTRGFLCYLFFSS